MDALAVNVPPRAPRTGTRPPFSVWADSQPSDLSVVLELVAHSVEPVTRTKWTKAWSLFSQFWRDPDRVILHGVDMWQPEVDDAVAFIVWGVRHGLSSNMISSAVSSLNVVLNLLPRNSACHAFQSDLVTRMVEGLDRLHWASKPIKASARAVHPPLDPRVVRKAFRAGRKVLADAASQAAIRAARHQSAAYLAGSRDRIGSPAFWQVVRTVRACAVAALCLRTMLRSAEVVPLRLHSLQFCADEATSSASAAAPSRIRFLTLSLVRSKTRKSGHPEQFRIDELLPRDSGRSRNCAYFWLSTWCSLRAIFAPTQYRACEDGGPLFIASTRGHAQVKGTGLRSSVRDFGCLGGLSKETASRFTIHSLRVSTSNSLRRQGYSDDTVRAMGRWSSSGTGYRHYIRLTEETGRQRGPSRSNL